MAEPYVKKAGQKRYRELRAQGVSKGDAAVEANATKAPPKKKAAKK